MGVVAHLSQKHVPVSIEIMMWERVELIKNAMIILSLPVAVYCELIFLKKEGNSI